MWFSKSDPPVLSAIIAGLEGNARSFLKHFENLGFFSEKFVKVQFLQCLKRESFFEEVLKSQALIN